MTKTSEARAHVTLRSYYQTIYEAAETGYQEYISSEHAGIHCARTAASNTNDHIWAQLVNRLDGVAGAKPVFDKPRNLRFIKIDGRRPLLLWIKKTGPGRQHRNYPTDHAGRLEHGQSEMFPRAEILVLGYLLKPDRLGLSRVSIHPPSKNGAKPEWWIDIIGIPVMKRPGSPGGFEITVRLSGQRRLAL